METRLSSEQVLAVLARVEAPGLTYQQLRDVERRGCIAPVTLPGGRGPRLYGVGDVMLLRLLVRLHAEPLLCRWQAWSVVAHLRDPLIEALVKGAPRVLVIQGAVGRLVSRREAASMSGVAFDVADVGRGVRDAMRAAAGDVWTGATWVDARAARRIAASCELVTV